LPFTRRPPDPHARHAPCRERSGADAGKVEHHVERVWLATLDQKLHQLRGDRKPGQRQQEWR
jgi:hypothetical protein